MLREQNAIRDSLKVAAAQPACGAYDVARNARTHAAVIRSARARVVVFPELSLTGYELDADPVALDDPVLRPIVDACAETGTVGLAGAPVVDQRGARFIAMLKIDDCEVRVAYRKAWLGGAEVDNFQPGDGPTVLRVDGWRLGLGICKDTGSAQHISGTAALGVDAYLAGLAHRPEELPEQEARAIVIARTCRAFVVFASFAGPTGDVFSETAGSSAIWSADGLAIQRAGPHAGSIAMATIA